MPSEPDRESTRTPILYLAPWVDLGGSDKGTIDWFRTIDRSRWAPSLITTQPAANRWLGQIEPFAEEIWSLPELMPGSEFPPFILGFIETRGVRVVHIMNSRLAFDLMPDMSCLPEAPVLVVQHHAEEADRSGYVRYVASRYGNLVDAFSVTSRQLRDAMLDYDVATSRIEVITTGVDATGEFDPQTVGPREDLGGEVPRILWPGRFVAQKDPMLTLEVVARLRARGHRFTVEMVGEGDLEEEMRCRIEALGIADHVRFHSPSQEMPSWYRSCDVLLMTSTFEGVPYVIYESLSMGVPVVAPALAGNVELLAGGGGILIDPRDDVEAYVDALELLLTDRDARAEMSRIGRARMLAECSLEEMIERHERLYERLLSRPHLARPTEAPSVTPASPPEPIRLSRRTARERSVCVIVPCYQHGRFLPQAIESLHRQTLRPNRVIVVDDASDDPETAEALDQLESDPLVEVIRLAENAGPSRARNRALAEVTENYVLPLDADDMLVDDALEKMVAQLEQADESVGFIYPNVQHFGNRHDYYAAPEYNLDALLDDNFCAAAALFDARVFSSGIRYAEDIVFGHEDWDLVLQMAAREIYGEPSDGLALMYRKRGYSRVNAVDYGPESFHGLIEKRHPQLYARRDQIKARWAPALSLLLIDGFDGTEQRWRPDLDQVLSSQSCADFETIVSRADSGTQAAAAERVAGAVRQARGRFVVIASAAASGALERKTFVESLIRLLWSNRLRRVALRGRCGLPFAALTDPLPDGSPPAAVAWRREFGEDEIAELGVCATAAEDILLAWLTDGPVEWRAA